MHDEAVVLGHEGGAFGVMSIPSRADRSRPAVLLLTAGTTHRIGPNRLYVRLARRLRAMGYISLRFDLPGVGDCFVRPAAEPRASEAQEVVSAALAALTRYGARTFIAVGLCSGGDEALRLGARDDFVGAIAVNATAFEGPITVEAYERLTRETRLRSFRHRLWRWSTMKRLLTLRVNFRLARTTLAGALTARVAGSVRRLSRPRLRPALGACWQPPPRCATLLAASEGSFAWTETPRGIASTAVTQLWYAGTDHLFTLRASQDRLIDDVARWVAVHFPGTIRTAVATEETGGA